MIDQNHQVTPDSAIYEYDINVLMDVSGSTRGKVGGNGSNAFETRNDFMKRIIVEMVDQLCAIDDDGIGVAVFAGPGSFKAMSGVTSYEQVAEILNTAPGGATATGEALEKALVAFPNNGKKRMFVILTDGDATDRDHLANVITAQANSQDADDECTILFLQVGYDDDSSALLAFLDDELQKAKGAKFDIVDSKPANVLNSGVPLLRILADAVDD